MTEEIVRLRDEIARQDRALLELLARRFELAAQVGRLKAERGQPVIVREVEQQVLLQAREHAESCGVTGGVMEAIFAAIIRGSVERQHRVGVELRRRGGRRVLVVGAAGAMGVWLRRFLTGIGHMVDGVDTAWAALPTQEGHFSSLAEVADIEAYSAIVVAVSLEMTPQVLAEVGEIASGLPVIEIASIKSHLRAGLDGLARLGAIPLSLHPMFGPGKSHYEPLTMVHAVLGDEDEERASVLDLFGHPYLDLVSVPFDRHDRLMGWLLGLAHLSGMLFGAALGRSRLDPSELGRVASTTFTRQSATSRSVLAHDPALYFAIQRLNPHRGEVYAALTAALGELTGAVERGDREAFAEAMERAATAIPNLEAS